MYIAELEHQNSELRSDVHTIKPVMLQHVQVGTQFRCHFDICLTTRHAAVEIHRRRCQVSVITFVCFIHLRPNITLRH
jgi:hypothetical protein